MAAKRWTRWILPAALVAAVVALNVASLAVRTSRERATRVPGLELIQPPEDVSALAIWDGTVYAGGQEGLFAIDVERGEALVETFGGELPADHVRALLVADGALWVGQDSGLFRIDSEGTHQLGPDDGVPGRRVRSLMLDGDGRVWVGTVLGVAVFDGGRLARTWTAADGLAADVANVIAQDAAGRVWIGSYDVQDGGLTVIDGDAIAATFRAEDGLPHPSVTCILPEADGTVWVGTGFHDRGGLARFDAPADGAVAMAETYVQADGLAGPKVRSLWRSPTGVLWVGSERDGIALWADTTGPQPGAPVLTMASGLSDNEVKQFLPLADGRLMLGTRNGITIAGDAVAIERAVAQSTD